jgi:hypothetical protein
MSPLNVRQPAACDYFRSQFSDYLDGTLTGLGMQAIAAHFDFCPTCSEEFSAWFAAQSGLSQLGRAAAPANLADRLRSAIALEREAEQRSLLHAFRPSSLAQLWNDSVGPIFYRAIGGMASTAVLMTACALLLGVLSAPAPLIADNSPASGSTGPRYLYSSVQPQAVQMDHDDTLLVQAFVNSQGHIYDYRILSGPDTPEIRTSINDRLLFSVYQPALVFGQPVRGSVLISFAGISVHG